MIIFTDLEPDTISDLQTTTITETIIFVEWKLLVPSGKVEYFEVNYISNSVNHYSCTVNATVGDGIIFNNNGCTMKLQPVCTYAITVDSFDNNFQRIGSHFTIMAYTHGCKYFKDSNANHMFLANKLIHSII